MIKKIILLLLIVLGFESQAQVGINTTTPKAQLEIKSTNEATPANTDGLIIPKINAFPLTNPTVDQQGMLVYLTTTVGAFTPGFYYWNNPTTAWLPVKGTDGGTLDQAYDFEGAGNGRTITADTGAVTIAGTDGLVSTGTSGSGALAPSGAGTRMVWNPRKAAFRAGSISGTQWDDANIGTNSVAFGNVTTASGANSMAFGNVTTASGPNSTAFGSGTTASNNISTAFGNNTIASGPSSTAFGFLTTASGASSTTFGTLTAATASNSSAFGRNNTASSYGETVIGIGATTYTPSTNGTTQFRTANATDRLFVIGNAIDANNNDTVETTERSDAMVVLKNGLTRLPSTTNTLIDAADGKAIVTKEWVQTNAINNAWSITGNSGMNPATHFVGTTDAQPFRFRAGNAFAGNISNTTTGLVSLGLNGGSANTGLSNTFMGGTAGLSNTTGSNNTFIGRGAGAANISTFNNTYVGTGAGEFNSTGQENVYVGRGAGGSGTSGSSNILIGNGAGFLNTANNNLMIGAFAGNANTTGGGNTFLGTIAGLANGTGGQNTFVGNSAGSTNSTGSQNTLIGNGAALNANDLTNATAIGRGSRVDVNDGLVLGSVNGINAATSTSLVGIGTTAPLERLHVVGSIRMVDGNQAAGRVLMSDVNGTASWANISAATAGTLDESYDFGGAGAGRTIIADTGAVTIAGTDGLVSTGTLGSGALAPSGAGTRMVWNPRKAAFRLGQISGATWDDSNIGSFSTAFGNNTTASGIFSTALGFGSTASGDRSIAFGFNSTSSGIQSTAIGHVNVASGDYSSVFGLINTAPSFGETVIGLGATTYTPSTNGATQFKIANAMDRLFVIGNAIDANNTGNIETAERSDAMVVLKNGNTGIGVSAPGERLQVAGRAFFTNGFSADNAALIYRNNTDYMFLGPQSGSSADGGAMALFGSTNVSGGNAGGIDFNVLNGQLRMTSAGNVGIGTTPARKFHVSNGVSGGTSNVNTGILLESNGNVYQHYLTPSTSESGMLFGSNLASINGGIIFNNSLATNGIQFRAGGNANRMTITSAGDVGVGITAPGGQFELSLDEGRKPGTGTWTLSSDKRLKTINGKYTKGLNEILQLNPILFNYKNNGEHKFEQKVLDTEFPGFIAQEVQPLFPDAVGTDADGFLNFNIHPILIASINAFKELNLKNQSIENKNRELELKLKSQEQIISNLIERLEKLEAKN